MIRRQLIIFIYLLLLTFLFVPDTNAQACGTSCNLTTGNLCLSNARCSSPAGPGICVQTSCTNSNPCCRSNRPVQPRTPTSPPSGGNPTVPGITTPGVNDPNVPGTKPVTPGNGQITQPPVDGRAVGDCSGPVEGTKDGKVDLSDFNLLRKEFSGTATTLFCDNDANGVVDLLDFNIFRIAFVAQK